MLPKSRSLRMEPSRCAYLAPAGSALPPGKPSRIEMQYAGPASECLCLLSRGSVAIAAECCRALAATKRLLGPFGFSATACRASLNARAWEPSREWQLER
eukprot:scaffold45043_cov63-Phaeocystis_antarctica.AAC.3